MLRLAEAEGLNLIGESWRPNREGPPLSTAVPSLPPLSPLHAVKCLVLVAKLDRLSRDVAFISSLLVSA